MKVRIIVKQTYQPPFDTPASISYKTVVVESEELANAINCPEDKYPRSQGEVIGAEVMEEGDE